MPETYQDAVKRATKLGYRLSSLVKADDDDPKSWFIAPMGIKSNGAKKAYAKCRQDKPENQKDQCAKIAWSVEKRINNCISIVNKILNEENDDE